MKRRCAFPATLSDVPLLIAVCYGTILQGSQHIKGEAGMASSKAVQEESLKLVWPFLWDSWDLQLALTQLFYILQFLDVWQHVLPAYQQQCQKRVRWEKHPTPSIYRELISRQTLMASV